jgi:hypothetical protein
LRGIFAGIGRQEAVKEQTQVNKSMADFVAVLKKTIDGLGDNTPAMREKVYQKARSTVAAKLAAISPPPPAAVAERQKRALDEAIVAVESSYTGADEDPFAELEHVFADPMKNTDRPTAPTPPVLAGSYADTKPWPGRAPEPDSTVEAVADPRPGVPFDGEDEDDDGEGEFEPMERRRNFAPLIAAAVALVVLAGGGYAVWLNRADFQAMLGIGGGQTLTSAPAAGDPTAPAAAKKTVNDANAAGEGVEKFTQRLNSDGSEIDAGPAGGIASLGEGTSVASVTPPPAAPADSPATPDSATPPVADALPPAAADATPPAAADAAPAAADETPAAADATPPAAADATPAAADETPPVAADAAPAATDPAAPVAADPAAPAITDPAAPAAAAVDGAPAIAPAAPATDAAATAAAADSAVAVGQKAIFYEERTNVAEGSAELGTIVWSLVQQSPGNDLPPEPAIRAEAKIPGKDLSMTMTIKRNVDSTIPASHTIEMIFITPDNFDGGGIENILRVALKGTEEAAGNPLLGIPVKITDGYFLVALSDTKAEIATNLALLKRDQWIDVPLVYKSGRRALFTMEKGVPGDKVFDEAIKAWQAASATAG